MKKGYAAVNASDFDAAIEVGNQLERMRHSSAFEILALAYAGQGDDTRAVQILEAGVEKAPKVWLLWELLGNKRSDLREYAKAHEAYKKALECSGVNESSVRLNMGILLTREDCFEEALDEFDRVADPDLQDRTEAMRLDVYVRQGEHEDVIVRGERLLAEGDHLDDETRALVLVDVGRAYWKGRDDAERALSYAWDALAHSHALSNALWLIRNIENEVSPAAQYFRILIEGDWPETDGNGHELGFFATYDVVADDVSEAMEYIKRIVPDVAEDSLRVSECSVLENQSTNPKGIYYYTGHALYLRVDENGT